MRNPEIAAILHRDRWSITHGVGDVGPYVLRFQQELLPVSDTSGYSELLTILWPYAEEDTGALPSSADLAAMEVFEERLHAALEHDAHAVITAVLTFDGARQWVVYTSDFMECGQRITDMPQNEDPYPIEMHAKDDPGWDYLRKEVLHGIQVDG
jgi:hypothetical protein